MWLFNALSKKSIIFEKSLQIHILSEFFSILCSRCLFFPVLVNQFVLFCCPDTCTLVLCDSVCVHPCIFPCLFACHKLTVWFVSEGSFELYVSVFFIVRFYTCQCFLSISLSFNTCLSALQTAAPPTVTKLVWSMSNYTIIFPFLCACIYLLTLKLFFFGSLQ